MLTKPIFASLTALVMAVSIAGCGTNVNHQDSGTPRTLNSTVSTTPDRSRQAGKQSSQATVNSGTSKTKITPGPNLAPWFTVDYKHKTMTLKLVAGYQGKNGGFNFNGYSHGKMTVLVPLNWHVNVKFQNADKRPHSAIAVQYSKRPATTSKPAFAGASTSSPLTGIGGGKSQSFGFKVTKKGNYAFVSAVLNDVSQGMWADVVVVPANTSPGLGT